MSAEHSFIHLCIAKLLISQCELFEMSHAQCMRHDNPDIKHQLGYAHYKGFRCVKMISMIEFSVKNVC